VEAVVASGSGDLPPASTPVEYARRISATLYLLPVRFIGVKSKADATEELLLYIVTIVGVAAPSSSPERSGQRLHAVT
jgi:hypothetical protein